jgi:Domain of unknown function (DUF4347)
MSRPLRLVVFDATQIHRAPRALGWSWRAGVRLYRALGWIDRAYAATSFASALDWVARVEPTRAVNELQFWGHGKWGRALIDREPLDRGALAEGHALRPRLEAVRERLTGDALIWFRTCETLGAHKGHDFARALSDFTGARIAGHTFVIGYYQSGLHVLAPGTTPSWEPTEGLSQGTAVDPRAALRSSPSEPNTITCLTSAIPSSCA